MRGLHKQIIEMFEGGFVGDEAAIDKKLHELTKSHGIGFGFGEGWVYFVESFLVAGSEEDGIVGWLCHFKNKTFLLNHLIQIITLMYNNKRQIDDEEWKFAHTLLLVKEICILRPLKY